MALGLYTYTLEQMEYGLGTGGRTMIEMIADHNLKFGQQSMCGSAEKERMQELKVVVRAMFEPKVNTSPEEDSVDDLRLNARCALPSI